MIEKGFVGAGWLSEVIVIPFMVLQLISALKNASMAGLIKTEELNKILDITPISYKESLERAFSKIERNEVVSSWKDAFISSGSSFNISEFISVPTFGCFKDERESYKGHKYYKDTIDFCENWDQKSFDPHYETKPLEYFIPMIEEIFSREARSFV